MRDRLKRLPLVKERERAQALSRPPRHRHRRAHALRAVAEGRRRSRSSPPTARRSTSCATRVRIDLPFVVGEGANQRMSTNISRLLDAAGDLRAARSAPASWSSQRRWNLQDELRRRSHAAGNQSAGRGRRRCCGSQREARVLERTSSRSTCAFPARFTSRLTEEAAAAREAARRSRSKGGAHMTLQAAHAPHAADLRRARARFSAVLDVGASKVVCLIARLIAGRAVRHAARPHPPLPHPRHRPSAVARHQGRRGRRHGRGRGRDPPRGRRRRAHGRASRSKASSST